MSSTAMVKGTDISITKFASSNGPAYQVTWKSTDKEHLFDYVELQEWSDVQSLVEVLRKRMPRRP